MTLVYKQAESTIKPAEIEKGKRTVYLRKDIAEEDRDGTTYWVYQEATMSHDEFEMYSKLEALKAQKSGDDNQMIIMEAIADLYEAITNM